MTADANISSSTVQVQEEPAEKTRSVLACESCRRRKIKCDRELPCCALCTKADQVCKYRDGPLKPGPKIGAYQRRRKRQRTDEPPPQTKSNTGVSGRDQRSEDYGMLNQAAGDFEYNRNGGIRREDNFALPNQLPSIIDFGGIPEYAPLSPQTTVSTHTSTPKSSINIHSLSFIVHPSHDAATDAQTTNDEENAAEDDEDNSPSENEPIMIARACYALNVSPDTLYRLIDLYFDKMTSFSLFRQPYFHAKIRAITSSTQLNALLAAMLAFSSRFDTETEYLSQQPDSPGSSSPLKPSDRFLDLAVQMIDKAMQECEDKAPPLCLLQALTLVTFQQLIKGVSGKAWRSLGTCVRIAYELYFHLIDSEDIDGKTPIDVNKWCRDEENRRVWWAIWEMDTFASTIRRCPTAIAWSQNETYLPVDDEYWFRGEFQQSCYLTSTAMKRWSAIQSSGNRSPKAWFIVVNSLMREAQLLSSPRGCFRSSAERSKTWINKVSSRKKSKEISQSLATIENALRCFEVALPSNWRYNAEYLSFASNSKGFGEIHRDSSVYSIHVMIQLTKFMIYHHGVFGGGRREDCLNLTGDITPPNQAQPSNNLPPFITITPDREALDRYSDAAERVLLVVNHSPADHIRYTNPFIASTIWLAAAVQLVYRVFCQEGARKTLVESNFEVLRLNYKQYVDYWKMSTSLQQNLDYLEDQLMRICTPHTNITTTGIDNLEIGTDFGSVPHINTHTSASQVASTNNSSPPLDNPDQSFQDNPVCNPQTYDNSLFDGPTMPMMNGDLGSDGNNIPGDPLEFLETLAFGLSFGMNDELQVTSF